ncbi:MAG: hypothetical protein B7Z59_06425 [Acidiphilium sp. 37-67-22]|nr:MAG: hypothetical protein B7Z59_06425 [Acidiphilium sp. 37-67-22]
MKPIRAVRSLRTHAPAALLAATMAGASIAAIALPHARAATPESKTTTTPAPHSRMLAHVDHRLAALKAKLRITAAEQDAWHGFAQVSRDNATAIATLYQSRAAHLATMNAVQNMESFAAIQARQADNMNKLTAAFQTLYGKLDASQQKTVDSMFRAYAEHHMAHHRKLHAKG